MGFVPLIQSNSACTYNSLVFIGSSQSIDLHLADEFGGIVLQDARWSKNGGVHIDSYYAWPRNLKELQTMIDKIRVTYSELCGIVFPS